MAAAVGLAARDLEPRHIGFVEAGEPATALARSASTAPSSSSRSRISLLTGVLFGVAPAITGLEDGFERRSERKRARRERIRRVAIDCASLLVISEVALSLVLAHWRRTDDPELFASARSQSWFQSGPRPDGLHFAAANRNTRSTKSRSAFFERLLDRLRNVPGVTAAGCDQRPPVIRRQLDWLRCRRPSGSIAWAAADDRLPDDQSRLLRGHGNASS